MSAQVNETRYLEPMKAKSKFEQTQRSIVAGESNQVTDSIAPETVLTSAGQNAFEEYLQ